MPDRPSEGASGQDVRYGLLKLVAEQEVYMVWQSSVCKRLTRPTFVKTSKRNEQLHSGAPTTSNSASNSLR
jgi:hypothetical protein